MFNSLVIIFLFLVLSMNALFASEKDYGNLTEITLKKGLNEKQARDVVIGLEAELMDLFNFWLTESHFFLAHSLILTLMLIFLLPLSIWIITT